MTCERRFTSYALGFVLCMSLSLLTHSAEAQDPIVYVRCARTLDNLVLSGNVTLGGVMQPATRTMRGLDIYDVLPDVTHFFGDFSAPCDLVYRDESGQERVLYDCASTSTTESACAAMDPAVSFDGRTIAFSVFRGRLDHLEENVARRVLHPNDEQGGYLGYVELPNRVLRTTDASLHLVDVTTGIITVLPHAPGTFDSGPAWLSDGRIAFTSDRSHSRVTRVPGATLNGLASQIWTMDPDGRNVDLASHHALAGEQHPFQLLDGRVAVSSWQLFGALPFRATQGSPGGFGTINNFFQLYAQNPDGAHPFALFGQHVGSISGVKFTRPDGTPHPSWVMPGHLASHFISQTHDGRIWVADYYRGNNNGLGTIIGFLPSPEGQEGMGIDEVPVLYGERNSGDLYRPRGQVDLAHWAHNGDQTSDPMPGAPFHLPPYEDDFVWAGKLSHPAATPSRSAMDPGLILTWGKGACSTNSSNDVLPSPKPPVTSGDGAGSAMNLVTSLGAGNDNPGCDAGIYRAQTAPVMHPSELVPIVDSPAYHEIMARAVVPFSAVHGVDAPAVRLRADRASSHATLELGTPFGLLGAASMLFRETTPMEGNHFEGESQWGRQGADTIDWQNEDLCGLRMLAVLPNEPMPAHRWWSMAGERVVVLGEVPVRNGVVLDARGDPDTSFLVRFPAAVPYLMQAIDCEGRTLTTDQMWQSLRHGETKTCGGCHVHSKPGLEFAATFAAQATYAPPRLGEGQVPLFAGESAPSTPISTTVPGYGRVISYENDIVPIFDARCASCHSGPTAAAGLRLDQNTIPATVDVNGSYPSWTPWCLTRDRQQSCVPAGLRHVSSSSGTILRRPQLTRQVRFMNARGSLLYWKAANERTDRRTDADFGLGDGVDNDIDFGPAHPTAITQDELRTLARWIDTGCLIGPGATDDTLRPTIELAAEIEGEALTALRVGTVDVPSGIDTGTLEVCILSASGCGPDLAGDAQPHGVLRIELASRLTDPDVEIRARVSDKAGNVTEIVRTVRHLLASPPLRPEVDGGVGTPTTPSRGCGCGVAKGNPALSVLSLIALVGLLVLRRKGGCR